MPAALSMPAASIPRGGAGPRSVASSTMTPVHSPMGRSLSAGCSGWPTHRRPCSSSRTRLSWCRSRRPRSAAHGGPLRVGTRRSRSSQATRSLCQATNRVVANGELIAGSAFWPTSGGSSAWLPVRTRFLRGGVRLWLDPEETLLGLRSLCSSHLAAHAQRESPSLNWPTVDLGLTGLPDVVGIDTVKGLLPRPQVLLIFKSRPDAPQPSQGRARGDGERPRLYGGPMASVKQFQVTFDCAEPERVARFWCEVLGYVVPPPPEGFATWDDFLRARLPERQGSAFACIDPSGLGPRLFFQRVPEGKVVKNRLHLDVRVGTGLVGEERLAALEAECARLVALGAGHVRRLPADGDNESCLVMQDIEGNEFCLD